MARLHLFLNVYTHSKNNYNNTLSAEGVYLKKCYHMHLHSSFYKPQYFQFTLFFISSYHSKLYFTQFVWKTEKNSP